MAHLVHYNHFQFLLFLLRIPLQITQMSGMLYSENDQNLQGIADRYL